MKRKDVRKQNIIQVSLILAIIILVNIAGSFFYTRLDLTSEKRYSLSNETKDMLRDMDDLAYVKVYLEGQFPAGFKRLRDATREMLDEFRVYAGDNIEYEFIDPFAGADQKQKRDIFTQLVRKGLKPTNLEVQQEDGRTESVIFPGAIITYKGREMPLQLLQNKMGVPPEMALNNSIQTIEFEMANAIRKLKLHKKPAVAFIEGHGELAEEEVRDITFSLSDSYDVERVRINGKLGSLKDKDVIIIAKPQTEFSEKDKFIIDQYIMNGGKALFLIDAVFTSMDSLRTSNAVPGIALDVNLLDMLFKYGARINSNLVMDGQLAAQIPVVTGQNGNIPQQSLYPWPFFPLILSRAQHPIVKNLDAIKLEFANKVDTVGAPDIRKTILLTTSKYTRIMNAPARVSLQAIQDFDPAQYNKSYVPTGVLLEGSFESVFKNRIPEVIAENKDISFREKGKPTRIIVVGDGDVIKNEVRRSTGDILPMDQDRYTRQPYGNRTFILNAVDYLIDESGIFAVRSKELRLRLMDRKKVKEEKGQWQVFNLALPVGIILLFAFVFGWKRKRKYGQNSQENQPDETVNPPASSD
ncbi:MAG: gliding motility-associated ABC transporter substrate-binding protein GldG [Flavobacteriales bacterium]|nr:gliding motility-associated ABC transporter substrate-binding protein GldG [Flavobacteriales bacterium]